MTWLLKLIRRTVAFGKLLFRPNSVRPNIRFTKCYSTKYRAPIINTFWPVLINVRYIGYMLADDS